MKNHGIISTVFIVGCATGGVAAQLVVPPVHAGTAPTRWQYQCATVGVEGGMTAGLNKLGAGGWELVTMGPASTSSAPGGSRVEAFTLCAKRALP